MRKVFVNDLPKGGDNIRKDAINWRRSVGNTVKFIYDDIEGEIKIVNYDPNGSRLCVKYLDEESFAIFSGSFLNGLLGGLLGKKTAKFKIQIGEIFKDEKRNIIITDRKYVENIHNKGKSLKYYQYQCNNCGYTDGWIYEASLLNGAACQCCSITPKIVVEGINDIPTTAPWMVKYFQGGYEEAKLYTKGSSKKINPICPDCGRVRKTKLSISNITKNSSIGCYCGDGQSYPNKFMYFLLEQLNINFQREFSPEWIKPKRYDFYFEINNKKYIIEMDGAFHSKVFSAYGKTLEEINNEDNYKNMKAIENNIKIIRINSDLSNLEFLKENIMKSELINLLNLNNVNWIECDEYATSNLCKKVCDMKNKNPNITVDEINKFINVDRSTIINYLNKGTKLGWCYYNGKEENIKAVIKVGKANGKPVEVFREGKSLGIFESCSELERISEKVFGTKLFGGNISRVCLGIRKHSKGYTFRYVEEVN